MHWLWVRSDWPRPRATWRGDDDDRALARLDLLQDVPALVLVREVVLRVPENVPLLQEHLVVAPL